MNIKFYIIAGICLICLAAASAPFQCLVYAGKEYTVYGTFEASPEERADMQYIEALDERLCHGYEALYSYHEWLLLEAADGSLCLLTETAGENTDQAASEVNQRPNPMAAPEYIKYNDELYVNRGEIPTPESIQGSRPIGIILSTVSPAHAPANNYEANSEHLLGHILYEQPNDSNLLISTDGGKTYALYVPES